LERSDKQTRKEHLSKLMAFMYLRVPLWNPNGFLNLFAPLLNPIMSKTAFIIWLLVIGLGLHSALENWPKLSEQGQGFLSPDNLILLYISMFILKFFHEMGHAIALKRFGGDTHTMGLMFIVFTPLPYVDATATWSMRSRAKRFAVGAAGMYVELFFAAISAVIWANTAPGLLNSMAFNMMVIGSISSLLFNGNPLLRFDAYYMLSDGLDLPNLYQKASSQWLYYFDKWLLATPKTENPAETLYEQSWFTLYGFLSYFYRLVIMLVIILYAADIWIGLGIALVLIALAIWIVIPLFKLVKYLSTSLKLRKNRRRAWFASVGVLFLFIGFLSFIPLPYAIYAPGVLQANESKQMFTQSGGKLVFALPETGAWVEKGTVLAKFENADLYQQRVFTQQQIIEIEWQMRQALQKSQNDITTLHKRLQSMENQLHDIDLRLMDLTIYAPFSGYWLPNQLQYKLGFTFNQAHNLGRMINPQAYKFTGLVTQEKVSELFEQSNLSAQLRLNGQTDSTLISDMVEVIPYRKNLLPSPVLSWERGGPIRARMNERGEAEALEPFFEVIVNLSQYNPSLHQLYFVEGLTGVVKFDLPWEPFFWQARQKVLQILQQRYQI
jgi:putative peptide zinc metalloprotease protein